MEKFGRSCAIAVLLLLSLWLTPISAAIAAQSASRVTVLYDAFGNPSKLVKDWGYAALVEYGGKRILFDTGNDAGILEHNVGQLGIDLKQLDAVVVGSVPWNIDVSRERSADRDRTYRFARTILNFQL